MLKTTLTVIAFLSLLASPSRAEQLEPAKELPEGITAEQVAYLIDSLAEGLSEQDLKLMDMSLEGLRATGQDPKQLLAWVEDAGFAAVVRKAWPRVATDTWTLAARAWAGDERARLRLRAWAGAQLIDKENVEEVDTRSRSTAVKVRRKSEALLALAWLKDEKAVELANRILDEDLSVIFFKAPEDWRFNMSWGNFAQPQSEQAIRALLRAGVKRDEIMKRIQDPEKKPAHKALLLWGLADVLNDEGFEAAKPLVEPYQAMLKEWLKTLTQDIAYTERFVMFGPLRHLPAHEEGLKALEAVRGMMAENTRRYMDREIRGYRQRLQGAGVQLEPAKPPTAPQDEQF